MSGAVFGGGNFRQLRALFDILFALGDYLFHVWLVGCLINDDFLDFSLFGIRYCCGAVPRACACLSTLSSVALKENFKCFYI